ncbi:MAG: hypothetical protein RIS41_1549 [Actinomycetota bacterium]|jgi:hypothetical protein
MTMQFADALRLLGLDETASIDDVHAARRRLARRFHPDVGGDEHDMVRLNRAVEVVVAGLNDSPLTHPTMSMPTRVSDGVDPRRWRVDRPSFAIDVLPAEAFEWLLLAARVLGEVVDDDPPYALEVLLDSRVDRWCRLEVVPDAGSSTVSIVVENVDPEDLVALWVNTINELVRSPDDQ